VAELRVCLMFDIISSFCCCYASTWHMNQFCVFVCDKTDLTHCLWPSAAFRNHHVCMMIVCVCDRDGDATGGEQAAA